MEMVNIFQPMFLHSSMRIQWNSLGSRKSYNFNFRMRQSQVLVEKMRIERKKNNIRVHLCNILQMNEVMMWIM